MSSFLKDQESLEIVNLARNGEVNAVIESLNQVYEKGGNSKDLLYLATKAIMAQGAQGAYDDTDLVMTFLREEVEGGPDVQAYTAAMTVQIRANRFEPAWNLFEEIYAQGDKYKLDEVAYVCGVRAAGFIFPWEATMEITAKALSELGPEGVLSVAHTAMTNLRYIAFETARERRNAIAQAKDMVNWLSSAGVPLSGQTLDTLLSVASTHGTDADVEVVLRQMESLSVQPTQVTFNTLLDKYARAGQGSAAEALLGAMAHRGLSPDTTTFNTLVKLCVRNDDAKGARVFMKRMQVEGIPADHYTHSLHAQVLALEGDDEGLLHLVSNPDTASPHVFSVAIAASKTWSKSAALLKEAVKSGHADQAVFCATAGICAREGQYSRAHAIVDAMLSRKGTDEPNKFTASFLVSLCLNHPGHPGSMLKLRHYLNLMKCRVPGQITRNMCQQVMSTLTDLGDWESASALHCSVFSTSTCRTDTLSIIFRLMQASAENASANGVDVTTSVENIADAALCLLRLYLDETQEGGSSDKSNSRKFLLRTSHFNSVIRILTLADRPELALELFDVMTTGTSAQDDGGDGADHYYRSDESRRRQWSWKPSTFTLAELIRCCKLLEDRKAASSMSHVLALGADYGTYIPLGVASDALSSVYDSGNIMPAMQMYEGLRERGVVDHWESSSRGRVLDLHDFSRAMAHCAIWSAVREMRDADDSRALTVITGKSDGNRQGHRDHGGSENQGKISEFVQDILINSFYPPISSATAVSNKGRLVIPPGIINKQLLFKNDITS